MRTGREVPLRVVVVDPPPGVAFAVQRGRGDLLAPSETTPTVVFDLAVRVEGLTRGGRPRFLGPLTQGPPDGRFLYVNSGTLAGQAGSCFTRRAKVPLGDIAPSQVDEVLREPGARLEARIEGRAADGGPACATVLLLGGGWSLIR
jgi:hypothetical protein